MKEFSMGGNDQSINLNEKDDDDDVVPKSESPKSKTYFVLNVPTAGQEAMVLRIGGCSGPDVDKFADDDQPPANNETAEAVDNHEEKDKDQLPTKSFTLCRPGWTTYGGAEERSDDATVVSSLSQTLQRPPSVEKKVEPANSHSVRGGRQKAVKAKKKASTEDYENYGGGDLVAIRECIAHIVCR